MTIKNTISMILLGLVLFAGIPWAIFSRRQKPGETKPLIASVWDGYGNWIESMPRLHKLILVIAFFSILFIFWFILE